MWIETQNGDEIIKVSRVKVIGATLMGFQSSDDEGVVLGAYDNENRANKVLGYIKYKITTSSKTDFISKGVRYCGETIYKMPNK